MAGIILDSTSEGLVVSLDYGSTIVISVVAGQLQVREPNSKIGRKALEKEEVIGLQSFLYVDDSHSEDLTLQTFYFIIRE